VINIWPTCAKTSRR